jgi:hypothetical protein
MLDLHNPLTQKLVLFVFYSLVWYFGYRWGKGVAKDEVFALLRNVMEENRKIENYQEWCAQCFKDFSEKLKDLK